MKKEKILATILAAVITTSVCLSACKKAPNNVDLGYKIPDNAVQISLSDAEIKADDVVVDGNAEKGVYLANDIVYYEAGKDFTYGEGTSEDAHTAKEAAEHTVLHIAKPGVYSISGTLSKGQIAVDLGEEASDDPDAVVTLVLNGADITCEVAPAIIFYSVYECGDSDTAKASKDVDTSLAGANLVIADGTENTVNGGYVAKIYKPDTVVLNDSKTEVEDAKKLHKYDGALYSKMSMNVYGEDKGNGVLKVNAQNEGIDSELHLTINGGDIFVYSGNDGINTNEDGVSVTTINGGNLTIQVTGETGEGDGIDSNGWLVINGGNVTAQACAFSGDAGIDSDMGIHINGGTVIASGHMPDKIENGGQNYAVFYLAEKQNGGKNVSVKNANGKSVLEACPANDYSILICSSPQLKNEEHTLWCDDVQLSEQGGQNGQMPGKPGMQGMTPPDGARPNDGQIPPDGRPIGRPDDKPGKTPPV